MFEKRYRRMMEHIQPEDDLLKQTLDAAEKQNRQALRGLPVLQLTVGAFCALVLLVMIAARFLPPPRDVVASHGETPVESTTFVPLASTPGPHQDVTVTAGTATIDAEGLISVPITIKSDALVNQVCLDFTDNHPELIAASYEGDFHSYLTTAGECQIIKRFRLQEGKTLSDLGESLSFSLSEITIFRNAAYVLHWWMDLNSLPFSQMQTCEAITSCSWWKVPPNTTPGPEHINREVIQCLAPSDLSFDLGCGIAITGLGFNADNAFVIQMRVPMSLPMGSSCIAHLVYDIHGENRLISGDHLGWWSNDFAYVYHQFTFPEVSPDNLHEYRLETGITPISDIITGNWPIIIPVSEIKPTE